MWKDSIPHIPLRLIHKVSLFVNSPWLVVQYRAQDCFKGDCLAVVSGICAANDPEAASRELAELIEGK